MANRTASQEALGAAPPAVNAGAPAEAVTPGGGSLGALGAVPGPIESVGFVPGDVDSQLMAAGPGLCPYCLACPSVPCALHRAAA